VTPVTAAATRQARSLASNSVMARMPLQPRLMWSQYRWRPAPNGETTPMPARLIGVSHLPYAIYAVGHPVN
jgi:hypothetical protein